MNGKKKHLSKRTLALLAAAVLLFVSGGFMGTRSALTIQSENMDSHFELDHIGVQLIEGHDGAYEHVGKQSDTGGELIAYMKENASDEIGQITPGQIYDEHIAAVNETGSGDVSAVDQYLRIIVRKYWADENGNPDNTLDPSLIKLTYGNSEYNEGPWQKNPNESTTEREVYYYTSVLGGQAQTPDLFTQLQLDPKVLEDMTTTESEWKNGKKIITYTYAYSGMRICIEAEVQALQTHSINRAIKSVWGVQNVSVSGGTLSVQ